MLDFAKLVPQLEGISADVVREDNRKTVEKAVAVYESASKQHQEFVLRLEDSESQTFWPLCMPFEQLGENTAVKVFTDACSVISVDGSQIMPSNHEVYNCYLINLGKVLISYQSQHPVIMESNPHLYHAAEDLYPLIDRRRMHVDELFVSMERSLLELTTMRDLALDAKMRKLPTVAFIDGSLIQWSLDRMPEAYQTTFLMRWINALDSFSKNRIPLVGYVSHSRSSDVTNALRVWNCAYETSQCQQFCGNLCEEDYPCSTIWPTVDRQLFGSVLNHHERAPLFASGVVKGVELPEEHRVCFTYLNTGFETARIELPRWITGDALLLEQTFGIILAQVKKGAGYPVCLAEAHNLAVVRNSDRSKFFDMVANHLVEIGVPRVRVSPKERGKRRGII